MVILIAPATDDGSRVAQARMTELGYGPEHCHLVTEGVLLVSAIDEWCGVDDPAWDGAEWLILRAPEPEPDDEASMWLHLEGGFAANTTDLVAVEAG